MRQQEGLLERWVVLESYWDGWCAHVEQLQALLLGLARHRSSSGGPFTVCWVVHAPACVHIAEEGFWGELGVCLQYRGLYCGEAQV